ncbi:MAG TPA: MFS transporter [Gemmatimonadaceae bacterium]|nr:MFS transporter [Gemmatimonadaceae bacterium]
MSVSDAVLANRSSAIAPVRKELSSSVVWLLTILAALTVANLYYNQPLLPAIARTYGVTNGQAGMVAVLTQVGYAIGLVAFVPLGDGVEPRRLMLMLLAAVTVSLVGAAVAPTLALGSMAALAIGATTVVPQIIFPLAAGLAPPERRGATVGRIMGGVLVGILGARTIAGFVGAAIGWRWMYAVAAITMALCAVVVRVALPAYHPRATVSYRELLRSLVPIARREPVARDAALLGALMFGSFSAFWTTLAFRLEAPPLHYGSRMAGLFGLLGITGAAVAPIAGRLADRRSARVTVGYAIAAVAVGWIIFAVAGTTLWGIAIGVVVLDAGVQAAQVSNQSRIYALDTRLHGRLNTIYMVSYFIGAAVGSALGSAAWEIARWPGVCAVGLGLTVAAGLRYRLARPPA